MSNQINHPNTGRLKAPNPTTYERGARVVGAASRLFGGLSWSGEESIPKKGAYILAANHSSVLDPPLLGAALLSATGDHIRFLANRELWLKQIRVGKRMLRMGPVSRPFSALLDASGAIPIERSRSLPKAVWDQLGQIVGQNGVIGIFPEGGLLHGTKIDKVGIGTGLIAAKYGLDIVPVGIAGSDPMSSGDKPSDFGRFHIHFGEPLGVPSEGISALRTGYQLMKPLQERMQAAVDAAYEIRRSA